MSETSSRPRLQDRRPHTSSVIFDKVITSTVSPDITWRGPVRTWDTAHTRLKQQVWEKQTLQLLSLIGSIWQSVIVENNDWTKITPDIIMGHRRHNHNKCISLLFASISEIMNRINFIIYLWVSTASYFWSKSRNQWRYTAYEVSSPVMMQWGGKSWLYSDPDKKH